MLKKIHIHSLARRRIRRCLYASMSADSRLRLFNDISGCERCIAYYNQCQSIESALCNDPVTVFAMERVENGVLYAVSKQKEGSIDKASKPSERIKVRFSSILKPVPVVACALTMLVTSLTLLLLLSPVPNSNRVQLSSAANLAPVDLSSKGEPNSEQSQIGIRVFKIASNRGDIEQAFEANLDSVITFTYTNFNETYEHMALFGVQQSGEVLWYYPDYGARYSILIDANKVNEPLGDGIDLGVNHKTGWLRITAVFSKQPITASAVEESVKSQMTAGIDLRELVPFEDNEYGTKSTEYSVLMEIADKK